jgi:hypothetical protein
MHKALIVLFFCVFFFCGALAAQDLRFAGPVSGFVYDAPGRSIRAIQGIPGSSYLGGAVVENIDFASIAPNGRSALIWSGGEASFVARLDESAAPRAIGASDMPDQIAWSPDSRAAVLYRATESRLERWRNLADTPAIDSPDGLQVQGRISFVTIAASGSKVAWGSETGLVLWMEGTDAQAFRDAGLTPGAIFSADGNLLFAAAPDRLVAIHSVEGGVYADPFVASSGVVLDAAGLAIDSADKLLYVADRATCSVLVYDTAAGNVTDRIPLDIAPSTMMPLLRPQTFLLNARNGAADAVWVVETKTRKAAYFVGLGVE